MQSYFTSDGLLHICDLAPGLFTAQLADGLKVLIKVDRRSPVAICNVWVRVGSNREPDKLRGWSHGIEHMLFKGTGKRREGDFAQEVADAGGSTNAGTGYETTNYHITVPAENLAVAVDILGDALLSASFDPASLDAERQVLVHENHMYDDIPFGFGVTWRWGMELAFDLSPYRHPIGGRDENLLDRPREDILAFYRSAYAPDNMTVVIAGDVDPEAALDLVREKFKVAATAGGEPAADGDTVIVAEPGVEPRHDACRLRVEYGDIQKAYAKLIWPGPGEQAGERPVLSLTKRVLSDGRSCRLYREVLEEAKLVDEFAVQTETGPREGVVLIDLETDPQRLAGAMAAICRVLQDLRVDGCTDAELERARIRVMRSFLFGSETVQGQAATLGYYEAVDDLPGAFVYPDRVAGVTRDDLAGFCAETFCLEDLSCLIYLPDGTDAAACGIPATAVELAELLAPVLAPVTSKRSVTGLRTGQAPRVGGSGNGGGADQPFVTTRLAGGGEISYRVDDTLPVIALQMVLTGGAIGETAQTSGLAALAQLTQVKGAGRRTAEALHADLEGAGAAVSPLIDRDYCGLGLTALSDRLDGPLDTLGELACIPSFAEHEIEQERRLALEQLHALADSPFQFAAVKLREMMYGDHPYGRPLAGTETSLPGLTRDQIMAWHGRTWAADRLQLVVSGSFDPDRLMTRLDEVLSGLPATNSEAEHPNAGTVRPPAGVVTQQIEKDQNQTVVLLGWPGPLDPDDDRVPLLLLKELLTGQSGRLFEALRNRRSLCYNTGVLSTAGFGQGILVGYVLTAPESATEARDAMLAELDSVSREEAAAEEFERARNKLVGNLLISAQANSSRVRRTLRDRIYGRDANNLAQLVEQIRACRPDQVTAVAHRLLDRENWYEVFLGPQG